MNIIRRIYLYKTLDNFMLLYPLYSVMFVQRGGLDTLQISTLLIIWSVTAVLGEIPTGVLADRYSRRNLLVIGELIRAAGYATWILHPTYGGYALGFVLWGVGGTLDSGTYEAFVYDELKAQAKEQNYAKVIGRAESLSMFVGLAATLLAAPVLKRYGYEGVVWGSVAAVAAAALAAASLPDKKRLKSAEVPSYIQIITAAAREVRRSPQLLRVIGFGILVATLFGVLDEYASLYLHAAHVKNYLIPLVSAAMFLPSIIIGFVAYRFERLSSFLFMLLIATAGATLFAAGKYIGALGVASFATFLLLTKLAEVVYGAKLQHSMQGSTRSTITSINAFGMEVASIGAYWVYGLLTKARGTAGTLEVFGICVIGLSLVSLLYTHGRLFRNTKLPAEPSQTA